MTELVVEDVDDALECAGGLCMERMEETDEDVDLRPRRPFDVRRYDVERGVSGPGESDERLAFK